MAKPWDWLRKELDAWVADGIVTPDQAVAIRARYPEADTQRPWGMILFSSLGAIIVGLGIILLFAYNWAAMPKFAKLATVFLFLILAHGGGIWLRFHSVRWRAVGEALTVLGTMLFGAGIWLVAQIYHINEHFPTAFVIWALGAASLAWALPSATQGAIAAVLFAFWGMSEGIAFNTSQWFAPLLAAGLLVPLVWYLHSRWLLAILVPSLAITLCGTHGAMNDNVLYILILDYAILITGLGYLARLSKRFPGAAPILLFYGLCTYYVCLYLATFTDLADELLEFYRLEPLSPTAVIGLYLPALAALAPWVLLFRRWRPGQALPASLPLDRLLLPLLVPLLVCFGFASGQFPDDWLAIPFNFIFLAHAVSRMAYGCRDGIMRDTVIGAILLSLLTLGRYFDLFDSLLSRGLAFIVVGVVLFGEGLLYARTKKRQRKATS